MPDVELVSVDEILRGFLIGVVTVPVHGVVPEVRPAEFVRAWRTGGGPINRAIDEPLVTVQAWAESRARAEDIARACLHALLNDYTAMPLVRSVEIVSGPYLDPDPDSRSPRYSINARLRVRGRR